MPEKKKEELFEIKEKLKKCQQERDNYLDGWKRTKADFLNHEKRELQRIRETVDQEKQDLFLELLSIEDDLGRLEAEIKEKTELKKLKEGTKRIQDKLISILEKEDVHKIETKNKSFDPRFHEAITKGKSAGKKPDQIEEIRTGYLFHDRVLRPTQVKVVK
jgi:molecular chaperone GrpE